MTPRMRIGYAIMKMQWMEKYLSPSPSSHITRPSWERSFEPSPASRHRHEGGAREDDLGCPHLLCPCHITLIGAEGRGGRKSHTLVWEGNLGRLARRATRAPLAPRPPSSEPESDSSRGRGSRDRPAWLQTPQMKTEWRREAEGPESVGGRREGAVVVAVERGVDEGGGRGEAALDGARELPCRFPTGFAPQPERTEKGRTIDEDELKEAEEVEREAEEEPDVEDVELAPLMRRRLGHPLRMTGEG